MNINVRKSLTQSDDPRNQRVTFNVDVADSQELRVIVTHHLPQWLDLFARKNAEYQDGNGTAFFLGERGQFSDMYRKMMKLKAAMWDDNEAQLVSEGVDEIIMDLIGHCFLTLEMRRRRLFGDGEIVAQELEELPERMAPEEFARLVESAGFFILPTKAESEQPVPSDEFEEDLPTLKPREKTDVTEAELEQAYKSLKWNLEQGKGLITRDMRKFSVGDEVRLKQHLGKGNVLRVLDTRDDAEGYGLLLASNLEPISDGKALWAHTAWVYPSDQKSPEELALEASLAQRGKQPEFFGDNVNRDAADVPLRAVKDQPQA